ncbi:MAG: UDP-N-acetylmuramoyl-L-alanine--D-glutamate ligase [Bacteroidota bacterium]
MTTDQRTAQDWRQRVPGARVTVVGAARSGLAAARLLAGKGAQVFLTDRNAAPDGVERQLEAAQISYEFGGHTDRALDADVLVVSPGVPTSAPLVQDALARSIPVVSEIEAASWFCDGPIVAVTGSNGKTTATALLDHIFTTAERKHVTAGNIGLAFSDVVEDMDEDTVALLEVSSFQLDHIDTFRPRVAVELNVTPDHLDRYGGDVEAYAAAKFRLFENQRAGDVLVYNADDERVRTAAESASSSGMTLLPFSLERELATGGFVRGNQLVLSLPSAPSSEPPSSVTHDNLMPSSDLALRGRHNLYNSLASAVVARAMEIRSDVVRESMTSFEGVPHRLETVRTVGGVTFVNDSKATNVNAVWYALESFADREGRVVLIAGGKDKGNDYGPLKRLIEETVSGIVAIGEGADTVATELGPHAERTVRAETMEEAIQYAQLLAEPGDTVLLSPACASFDMFDNYEHRGDTFKRLVHAL